METNELVNKCIQRDHAAWNIFAKKYKNLLEKSVKYKLRKLYHYLPDDEVLDIVQEILMTIWEEDKLKTLRDVKCLKSWLVMVAVNRTINYLKSKSYRRSLREVSLDKPLVSEDKSFTLKSLLASSKFETEKEIENSEIRRVFEQEIKKLSPKQQLVIRLNLYDGAKHKDIAKVMNLPVNTVSTMIKRAKEKVKTGVAKYMEGAYGTCE